MDKLEKLIFLEITNRQFTKFHNKDFFDTYKELNEQEQNKLSELTREIHSIWNVLNGPAVLNASKKYASFQDFHSENKVSPEIVKVIEDFGLTLKTEISEELKNAIIKHLGQGYFDENFGDL